MNAQPVKPPYFYRCWQCDERFAKRSACHSHLRNSHDVANVASSQSQCRISVPRFAKWFTVHNYFGLGQDDCPFQDVMLARMIMFCIGRDATCLAKSFIKSPDRWALRNYLWCQAGPWCQVP